MSIEPPPRLPEVLRALGIGLRSGTLSLAEPDPRWVIAGALICERLPSPATWEHIGSTAVAGLVAKPIVDVLGEVPADVDLDGFRPGVEALGFQWLGEYGIAGRRLSVLRADGYDLVHAHLFGAGHPALATHRTFVARLRADPAALLSYATRKREILGAGVTDRAAYTDAKASLIRGLSTPS